MPNKKFWKFRNSADGAELLLYGDISQSSWWGDEVTPKQFADDLNAISDAENITVRINSGGGDVFAAQAIGSLLGARKGKTTARIDGLCASAATIVACHCSSVVAANEATYMIHPVRMGLFGYLDATELEQYIGALNTIKENILNLYVKKTGRDKSEVTEWMDATSWWTAGEAKENGFIDELVDDEDVVVENRNGALFVNNISMNLPFAKVPKHIQNELVHSTGSVNNPPEVIPVNNSHKEEKKMAEIKTVDDLRAAYPEFVNEACAAAVNEAVTQERERIRDIEDMAMPGFEDQTNEAKFVKPIAANEYAVNMMKAAKKSGEAFLNSAKEDAEGNGVNNVGQDGNNEEGKEDPFINAIHAVNKK